jgi:peptide/nickel transport system substrate-binding protein
MIPKDELNQVGQSSLSRSTFLRRSAALLAVPGLTGLSGASAAAATAATRRTLASGILAEAYPSVPSQVDPTNFSGNDMEYTTGNCYATLMKFVQVPSGHGFDEVDTQHPTVVGWLAESLQSNKSLTRFRIALRSTPKSVFGNTLSAEDVRWTIERNTQTPGNGRIIVQLAGMKGPQNVAVISDNTVELRTSTPNRLMPLLLQNMFGFGIVDSTEAKKHASGGDKYAGKWLARNTAGYGPYQMTTLTTQQAVFDANPNYFATKPTFSTVKWVAVPDAGNRFTLVQNNSVQIITDLEPQQIKQLKGSSTVNTYATGIEGTWDAMHLNSTVPELKDPRVRQALAYATPFAGILASVYQNTGTKWTTPIGGTAYAGADPSLNPYTTDPAKAKQLLAAANASNLNVKINYDVTSFWQKDVSIQLQTAWQGVGIKVDLEGLVPAVWGQRLGKKQMPIFFVTLGSLVPDIFYEMSLWYLSASGLNFGGYSNPKVDALLQKGLAEPSAAKRNVIARATQKAIMDDAPIIGVAVRDRFTAIRSAVKGYSAWMNGMVDWSELH